VLETVVDDAWIESRRDDELRSGFARCRGLGGRQHRTSAGEHIGRLGHDATQRFGGSRRAERDLGTGQSPIRQGIRQRDRVVRVLDRDHGN
jgi:hypothetical protein